MSSPLVPAEPAAAGDGTPYSTIYGDVYHSPIEKSVKESQRHDVVARFEDGSTRTFSSDSAPAWQSGDRVRLQNGLLTMGGGSSYRNGTI